MKTTKKVIAVLIAVAIICGAFAACGGNEGKDDGKYTIGIVQLVEHVALDAATQGFMDAVKAELGEENVTFDFQNGQNDANTCATIANQFVSNNVDLIMANATPALQAAVAATDTIPILGTSVTEYGVALGIKDFNGTVGGNVSGTSDLAPLDKQADMIKAWVPDAKTVGLLYCSKEANSQYQVDVVKTELENDGLTVTMYPFSDSNALSSVCTTAAENTGIIDNICQPAGVPVIAGEEGICAGCGIATLSISYYDLGYTTGKMAAQILKGEADISTMPIGYAETQTPKYNATICKALNITPLADYVAIEAK